MDDTLVCAICLIFFSNVNVSYDMNVNSNGVFKSFINVFISGPMSSVGMMGFM